MRRERRRAGRGVFAHIQRARQEFIRPTATYVHVVLRPVHHLDILNIVFHQVVTGQLDRIAGHCVICLACCA
jgi:hypothetical protein